jgi:hypothetical protein
MRHSVSSSPWLRATLLVTLTLSLSACGVGEPPVTPGPGPGIVDRTAPAAPTTLSADAAVEGVTLAWAANSETDLAGYRVSRADGANGPFTNLNTDLLTASQYTDTTAPTGRAVYYRVVAVDNAGNVSAASAVVSATRPAPVVSRAEIAVENLDVTPYPDRLVFSRIQSPASPGQVSTRSSRCVSAAPARRRS